MTATPQVRQSSRTRRPRARVLAALLLLPLAIGVEWLGAHAPETVEALYSRTVFPPVVAALAWLSSRVPFSLTEVCAAVALAALVLAAIWTGRAFARGRGHRLRLLGRVAVVVFFAAGVAYTLFLFTWGLNYQRVSFARSAGLQVRPSDRTELAALSASLIDAANALREGLPEDDRGAMRLADGPSGALTRTRLGVTALMNRDPWLPRSAIRPKAAWASPLLARMGIAGFYSPFLAEPQIDIAVSASEVPSSAAHEVGHQLGFAREDEANYLGYLICRLHPDADFRYSGVFLASRHLQRALSSVDRAGARALEARRSPAVKRDLAALAAWVARYSGPVMTASNRVNDMHLRIQGQPGGARSYGRMVDLLLAEWRKEANRQPPSGGK